MREGLRLSLLAEAQFGDNGAIALDVLLIQVGKLPSSLSDHLEESPPGVVVMAVDLEVFGEPVDLLCKEGHLYFCRTRISLVTAVRRYEAVLLLFD
jgi:hypothetical protein